MNVYQASRIDAEGFYVEPELIEEGIIPVDEFLILVSVPEGLHRPKWDGEQWVEGKIITFDLEQYKRAKKDYLQTLYEAELNSSFTTSETTTTILGLSEPISFVYDDVAQKRFMKQTAALALDTTISSVDWFTSAGPMTMTREQYTSVIRDGKTHETTVTFNFLYAEANIDNATTKEEVDTIVEGW